jgi:hypothetical protein
METIQNAMGNDFGGFRIYLGFEKTGGGSGIYHLILVGVDKTTGANHLVDNEIFDDFKPCPTQCISDAATPAVAKTDLNYDDTDPHTPPVFRYPK